MSSKTTIFFDPTIVTFLMVFLIQRAQNKDTHAIELKLDELLAERERVLLTFGIRATNRVIIKDMSLALNAGDALGIIGPSACGKSSLAIAGVAARIDEQLVDGADGWELVTLRPSQARLRVQKSQRTLPFTAHLQSVCGNFEHLKRKPWFLFQ